MKPFSNLSIKDWIPLIGALLVVFLIGLRTSSNSDLYIHLASGKAIAEHGLTATDSLTWSQEGSHWVKPTWLYDSLASTLATGTGSGLTLLHAIAFLAAFLLLVPVGLRWGSGPSVALGLLLCAWLVAPRLEARPSTFTMWLPALFIYAFHFHRSPSKLFAILIPAQILWSNLSSTFLIGPLIALAFAIECHFYQDPEEEGIAPTTLWSLVAALIAASLIHPFHIHIFGPAFLSLLSPASVVFQHWISPVNEFYASDMAAWLVNGAIFLGASGLVFLKSRLPLGVTIIALLSAFLVWNDIMLLEVFVICAFPFFALSFEATGFFLREKTQGLLPSAVGSNIVIGLAVLLSLVSIGSIVSNQYYVMSGSSSTFGTGIEKESSVEQAVKALAAAGFAGRLANQPADGGGISYFNGDLKTFSDQRLGLFDSDLLNQYSKALLGTDGASWNDFASSNKVSVALLNSYTTLAPLALANLAGDNGWALIYFDGTSIILAEQSEENQALIQNTEIQRAGLELIESTRSEFYNALSEGKTTAVPPRLIGAASVFFTFNMYQQAHALYDVIAKGAPQMSSVQLRLGYTQLKTDRKKEALETLEGVASSLPNNVYSWLYLSEAYKANKLSDEASQALDRANMISPKAVEAYQKQQKS